MNGPTKFRDIKNAAAQNGVSHCFSELFYLCGRELLRVYLERSRILRRLPLLLTFIANALDSSDDVTFNPAENIVRNVALMSFVGIVPALCLSAGTVGLARELVIPAVERRVIRPINSAARRWDVVAAGCYDTHAVFAKYCTNLTG